MGDSSIGDTQTLGFKDFIASLQAVDASSLFSKFDGILNSDSKSSFNLRLNSGKAAQGGPVSFTVRFFDKPKIAQLKQLIHDGKCSPTDAFKELNTLIEKGRIIFEYKDKAGALHACSSEEVVKALKSGQHKLIKKSTNEVCEYQLGAPLKTEEFSELAHLVDSTLKLTDTKKEEKKQNAEAKAASEPKAAPEPKAVEPKTAPPPLPQEKAEAEEPKQEMKPQAKDQPQTNPKEVDPPQAEQTENVFDEIIDTEISTKEPVKELPKEPVKEQAKPVEVAKDAPKEAPKPKEAPAKEAAVKKEEKPALAIAKEPEKSAPPSEKASSEKAKDVPPTSPKEVP